MNYVIRFANQKDIHDIVELMIECFPHQSHLINEKYIEKRLNDFEKSIAICVLDLRIVGVLEYIHFDYDLSSFPNKLDEIQNNPKGNSLLGISICVRKSYRNLGIGTELTKYFKSLARKYKKKYIVAVLESQSLNFNVRKGYKVITEINNFYGDGKTDYIGVIDLSNGDCM